VTPATPSPSPTTSGTAGGTPAATRTPATATRTPGATPSPTTPSDAATLCRRNPNPEDAPNDPIQITDADFNMQNPNATLLNIGDSEVNLTGWTLCSITSDRAYALVLSIASQDERTLSLNNAGETSDAEPDDAALYDPDGTLIAYFEE
jgi:hypothetical protein